MPKYSAKQSMAVDVLVLGAHPAAYLAAALLKQKSKLRIVHGGSAATSKNDDRLIIVNPELFDLHPIYAGLRKSVKLHPIHGLMFLSDAADTCSEHRMKSPVSLVARFGDIRDGAKKLAELEGVEMLGSQAVQIHRVDETGLEMTAGKFPIKPNALVVAMDLPDEQKKLLGIPDSWGPDVVRRVTSIRCKSLKNLLSDVKQPLMPMSLDLCGQLCWGWLIPGEDEFQIVVEQPIEIATADSGLHLLRHWVKVLQLHGVLSPKFHFSNDGVGTVDLPFTGALAQEGVANRTLLIGPAGGFYSACAEEMYPCCWSALFAADVMKKALKEKHLQDALNPYRQKWRTTLGDYLRGPQQNLRFLLPLVYRNPAMTARLAEAILLSKSVVR